MSGLAAGLGAAVLLASSAPGPAQTDLALTSAIRLPDERRLRHGELVDFDLDGRDDVVLVASGGGTRVLQVHLRRDGGFVSEPDYTLELTPDVVAYAVADVHADAGAELVLFSPEGAFAWRPRAKDGQERFVLLFRTDFLWQLPSRSRVYPWDHGVRDVDGDGLADLLSPEPEGYRVARQRRAEDGTASFAVDQLLLPADYDGEGAAYAVADDAEGGSGVSRSGDETRFSLRIGSRDVTTAPLFTVSSRIPAPFYADWDADGDLDVLAQGSRYLFVWLLGPGGYAKDPDLRLLLPVEAGERRNLDVSYSALATDLDGDRRVDCLILAGDKRAADVRSQLQVFTQEGGTPLFGAEGLPRQLLVLAGFAGVPSLDDVDGDGRVDLVVGALRPDLIDTLRSASSKRIDVELYVYLNQGGRFSKRPDLSYGISVPVEAGRVVTRFFGDVTGDGVSDLLTRHDDEHLEVRYTRRGKEGLTILDQPLWQLHVDPSADLVVEPGGQGRRPQLLVLEDRQLLYVGFR